MVWMIKLGHRKVADAVCASCNCRPYKSTVHCTIAIWKK